MKTKVFNYEIIEVRDLSSLEEFKNHNRLRVFYHKGCKCINCGKVGTKLILGKSKSGSLHWDVYDDELFPLNVDHDKPKSKGGLDTLDNLQPMCVSCNRFKGNRTDLTIPFVVPNHIVFNHKKIWEENYEIVSGDAVFNKINGNFIGFVDSVLNCEVSIIGKKTLYPINIIGKKLHCPHENLNRKRLLIKNPDLKIGDRVYGVMSGKFVGVINQIMINEKSPTKELSANMVGKNIQSLYALKQLSKLK